MSAQSLVPDGTALVLDGTPPEKVATIGHWLRSGALPRAAVAAVGAADPCSHPRLRSRVAAGRTVVIDMVGTEDQWARLSRLTRDYRVPLWSRDATAAASGRFGPDGIDGRHLEGPFDVVGDVHGCRRELFELLDRLGYRHIDSPDQVCHPQGRIPVLAGDTTDKGPDSIGVLRWLFAAHAAGRVLAVAGNHERKLGRLLRGETRNARGGAVVTARALEREPDAETLVPQLGCFLGRLPSHLILGGGRLVVAHAGLPAHLTGDTGKAATNHALFGDVRMFRRGRPARGDWTICYDGYHDVVHGHVSVPDVTVFTTHTGAQVVDVDTDCVGGGALSAWAWPERVATRVESRQTYRTGR